MKRIRKVEVNPHYYVSSCKKVIIGRNISIIQRNLQICAFFLLQAELDDATVAKRRKLDCELGRNKRGFIARVFNWIKSVFVSEEEC